MDAQMAEIGFTLSDNKPEIDPFLWMGRRDTKTIPPAFWDFIAAHNDPPPVIGIRTLCVACNSQRDASHRGSYRCPDCGALGDRVLLAESAIDNPLLDIYQRVNCQPSTARFGSHMRTMSVREQVVWSIAFSVPIDPVLKFMVSHGPIVEMGAGVGYWAWCLRQHGADLIAYDNEEKQCLWSEVLLGEPADLAKHSDRSLLLSWPPYDETMATECLEHWKGDRLFYVGEWGGCTADEKFHQILDAEWEEDFSHMLPQWFGIHDYFMSFTRK